MIPFKTRLLRASLDVLYHSGLCALLDARAGGVGAIFMLHHVLDRYAPPEFSPNRGLEVSAGFLDSAINEVIDRGYEVVDLDEARRRLTDGDFECRFACFTLDDGYADNYHHAMPVFQRHNIPFTVYVNSGLPDGTTLLWWRLLERVIANNDDIHVTINGRERHFSTAEASAKNRAWNAIYPYWRSLEPTEQQRTCREVGARYGVDAQALCQNLAISWDQLRKMSATGLATIATHTVNHKTLTALPREEIEREMIRDCDRIEAELGRRPRHLAYPYGDRSSARAREFAVARELGFSTATTARKGVLFAEHAGHLHALPRISLNGEYQELRYLRALLTGGPFAISRGMRRLDVA